MYGEENSVICAFCCIIVQLLQTCKCKRTNPPNRLSNIVNWHELAYRIHPVYFVRKKNHVKATFNCVIMCIFAGILMRLTVIRGNAPMRRCSKMNDPHREKENVHILNSYTRNSLKHSLIAHCRGSRWNVYTSTCTT